MIGMSERKRTKILITYELQEGVGRQFGRVCRQVMGAKNKCESCPDMYEGYVQVGKVTVQAKAKADEGSKSPGPNTFEGVAVCFHPERSAPLYGHPEPLEEDPIAEVDAIMEANLRINLNRIRVREQEELDFEFGTHRDPMFICLDNDLRL